MDSKLFSNRSVALIALVLMAGILLDGKAYNRRPPGTTIYSISEYPTVKVIKNTETIMHFEYIDDRWYLTAPLFAPVRSSRIKPLLDTNSQTTRSYNPSELNTYSLFDDPITLEIDNHKFQLGEAETVSQMRYVQARDKIYLQADHVIPLLRGGQKAFIDLAMTGDVTNILINGVNSTDYAGWSELNALGIISPEQTQTVGLATITIESKSTRKQTFNLHAVNDIAALVPPFGKFGYLLSAAQIKKLGLAQFF